jgi:hypothetical protein
MKKLSRNNSGKITLHQESNKIGFAIFWFFCDFIWILQKSANHTLLFQNLSVAQAPGISEDSQPYPCFAVWTSEGFPTLKCSPWGGGRHGSKQIPAMPAAVASGSGRGAVWWSPKLDLGGWPGLGGGPVRGRTDGRWRWLPRACCAVQRFSWGPEKHE